LWERDCAGRIGGYACDMNSDVLFRLSGFAALAGGALRIAAAFPLTENAVTIEWLYTAIDVLLLFGLMGIYLARATRLGFLGLASFAVAIAALSFIGGPDADPFGFSTYEQGAAALAIAMVGLSIAWVRAGERPFAPPICWFASVICVGVLNMIPQIAQYGFVLAGVLFGMGFMLAGLALLRRPA
jgi:hypothetical protein